MLIYAVFYISLIKNVFMSLMGLLIIVKQPIKNLMVITMKIKDAKGFLFNMCNVHLLLSCYKDLMIMFSRFILRMLTILINFLYSTKHFLFI